jgi:hypothetical protein
LIKNSPSSNNLRSLVLVFSIWDHSFDKAWFDAAPGAFIV